MKHTLVEALRDQREQLAAIAGGWLAAGANRFAVYPNGYEPLVWPDAGEHAATDGEPGLSRPILVNGAEVARLEVSGVQGPDAEARLAADATVLAALLRQEDELSLMTSQLVTTQDQLLSLYNLADLGQQRVGLQDVLQQMAQRAAPLFPIEGVFALVSAPGWPLLVEHHPLALAGQERIEWILGELDKGVSELWWRDESGTDELANLLVSAVSLEGAVTLALGLVNKAGEAYTVPEVRLVQAIVEHGGTQVENILLYEQTLKQARLQAEMELAQSVQLNLLPEQAPDVPGLQIWADSVPASQVGGDFYDFVHRAERPFTFAVGDVSGKGLPAALLMAMTRAVIRANLKSHTDLGPQAVVARTNSALYSDFAHVGMFATLFVGQYNAAEHEIVYANAGHSPVIYAPAGKRAELLVADGTALGILPTTFSSDQRLKLESGDLLVVATDGFSEAWNADKEMFGYDRLLALVEETIANPAHEIGRRLYETVDQFNVLQSDDRTLLVIKGGEV
ncbi:MAG: PP2C family protein-serine/threonine phosphatase [Anaerolineae bacterium]|nr:PP2C family protein-serine/threonine phosphatase [Anaerolineae bacterium]